MVSTAGKQGFLRDRGEAIEAFLTAGVAVCLPDVRWTGETRPGGGAADRASSRTSISQTEMILGQTLLGSQLRDLRTVIRWLRSSDQVDGRKLAVWGDSFAREIPVNGNPVAEPLDADVLPATAEPGGALLAILAGAFEDDTVVYARGGVRWASLGQSPYLWVAHESVLPGIATPRGEIPLSWCGADTADRRYCERPESARYRSGKAIATGRSYMGGESVGLAVERIESFGEIRGLT